MKRPNVNLSAVLSTAMQAALNCKSIREQAIEDRNAERAKWQFFSFSLDSPQPA